MAVIEVELFPRRCMASRRATDRASKPRMSDYRNAGVRAGVRSTSIRFGGSGEAQQQRSVPVHRHSRIERLQRSADIGRTGALDVLRAVAAARHRQALAGARRNMAAGIADALA